MRVIYLDSFFLENAVVDYILLIVTARMTGVQVKRLRVLAASLFGGAYAALAVLGGMGFLACTAFKAAVCVIMTLVVFGRKQRFLRILLVFLAVSAAFAGMVTAAVTLGGGTDGLLFGEVTFKVLAVSFAVCYAVFSLVFNRFLKHRVEGRITGITIELNGRSVSMPALIDTGNELYDPMTGRRVIVCGTAAVSELFDKNTRRVLERENDPARAMQSLGADGKNVPFMLVPFRSVGERNGMLLAFRPDRVTQDGTEIKPGLVAVTNEGIPEGGGYSALINAG